MDRAETAVLQVLVSTQRRGAEVFATDLGQALRTQGTSLRSVALVAGAHPPTLEGASLGTRPLGWRTLRQLRSEVSGAGVVIAHGSRTLPACALAMAGLPVPFVYRNIGDPTYWSGSSVRRARVSLLLGRAEAVAALWPGAADELSRRYGVAGSKIRIIPNGVPAERFPAVQRDHRLAARQALAIASDASVVVYVGSLTPEKDVGLAVRALAQLDGVQLLVVGDGPQRQGLATLAAKVVPGRVRFLGAVDDPASVLAAADALVLPSRSEGMPGVLIEAGLCELPVVATAVGGVGEVVVDGETGRLVPPGQVEDLARALHEVVSDPAGLGAAARRRCLARFEIGPVAEAWADLLAEVTR